MCSLLKLTGWADIKEIVLHHLDAEARLEAVLVCKEFYGTICHLERNKLLVLNQQLINLMKNKNIFDSIMSSSRRFEEVKANSSCAVDAFAAARTLAVVQKFKNHMKKLSVTDLRGPLAAKVLVALLNAAVDVEELSMFMWEKLRDCNLNPDKDFTKLKHLTIVDVPNISGILNKIPDHTLKALLVRKCELSKEQFQNFVNRQNKLKTLRFPMNISLKVDHLALEELELYDERDDKEFAALLKHQPALRYLRCNAIEGSAFNELRKMRNLEVLRANISEECAGELPNLKELVLRGDNLPIGVFRQKFLPKLEKFVRICDWKSMMAAEDVVALGRSAQNLQHIEIQYLEIKFVTAIIELFPKLKTLFVLSHAGDQDSNDDPALSRQNLSLEEIVINRHGPVPIGSLYETINDCPNLRRISLGHLFCSELQILGLIRSHPQLTHFAFNDPSRELFQRPGDGVGSVHPVLIEVIDIFRASAGFKLLYFEKIADLDDQRVEDLLTDDANRVIVNRYINAVGNENCNLKLLKRLTARDPFGNFNSNKLLSYD